MPIQLLRIRWIQIFRSLIRIPLHALLLLSVFAGIAYISFHLFDTFQHAALLIIVMLFTAFFIQYNRSDKKFVYKYLEQPVWQIYLEYAFFSTLLSVGCLFSSYWYLFILLQTCLYMLAQLQFPTHYTTPLRHLGRWMPASCFELIAGFRQSYFIILPLYLLACIFSWFNFLPLVMLWILNTIVLGFFQGYESLQIVTAHPDGRHHFMLKKIAINILYLACFYAPILLIHGFFNPQLGLITGLFFLMQVVMLAFVISLKYAGYEPNTKPLGNDIVLAIMSMASFMPYLLPIPLLMTLYYYPKAIHNLKRYLT